LDRAEIWLEKNEDASKTACRVGGFKYAFWLIVVFMSPSV